MTATQILLLTLALGVPNLDFASGSLADWQGQGFALVPLGSSRVVTSIDSNPPPRLAILHRTLILPPNAAAIRFSAALIRPDGSAPGEMLDIVLEGAGRTFAPREVREADRWHTAPTLLPPDNRRLRDYRWSVEKFAGKRVRIALVDSDLRPGCYLICSGFRIETRDDLQLHQFAHDMLRLQLQHGLSRFVRYDSKHFVALSNAPAVDSEYRLFNCETLYDSFFEHFRKRGFVVQPPAEKLLVALFDSQKGFAAYLGGNPGDSITGIFHLTTNRLVVYDYATNNDFLRGKQYFEEVARRAPSDLEREARTVTFGRHVRDRRDDINLSTMMHEVAHQLSFNCGLLNRKGDAPAWLVEGLAVYCESTRSGIWQGIGEPNPHRAATLARQLRAGGDFLPLRQLLRSDDWCHRPRRVDLAVLGYAQSWALFRLLIREQPDRLRRYLDLIRDRRSPDHRLADFASVFGADLDRLEKRYFDYLRQIARNEAPRP